MNERQHRKIEFAKAEANPRKITYAYLEENLKKGIIPSINSSIAYLKDAEFKKIITLLDKRTVRNKFTAESKYKNYKLFREYILGVDTLNTIKNQLKQGKAPEIPLKRLLSLNLTFLKYTKSFLIQASMLRLVRDKLKDQAFKLKYIQLIKLLENQINAAKQRVTI